MVTSQNRSSKEFSEGEGQDRNRGDSAESQRRSKWRAIFLLNLAALRPFWSYSLLGMDAGQILQSVTPWFISPVEATPSPG